ncbi:hypothetical protein HY379_02110 [Candidatus Saccharibacteria bacterium]|nr:hypothetical protein [Candidatus Saccharibacteria bacterium]
MSFDFERYDPILAIEEADAQYAEQMERAKRLDRARQILGLVAKKLAYEADRAAFFGQDLGSITIDPKELMDIVGERADPKEAVVQIMLGSDAVLAARNQEAGIAKAAKDTADFIQSELDDDSAT